MCECCRSGYGRSRLFSFRLVSLLPALVTHHSSAIASFRPLKFVELNRNLNRLQLKTRCLALREDCPSRSFTPREFSGVQFHEVVHARRRLASELEQVIRYAVIPPLYV